MQSYQEIFTNSAPRNRQESDERGPHNHSSGSEEKSNIIVELESVTQHPNNHLPKQIHKDNYNTDIKHFNEDMDASMVSS